MAGAAILPAFPVDVVEHVLQRPYGEDIELIEAAKIHTADSIEDALAHGVDHAMNAFNPKKKK